MASFGKQVTPQELIDMHPLRRGRTKMPEKSPEVKAAESRAGWAAVNRFFEQQKRG